MNLVCPIDARRVPEVGDTVVVRKTGVVRPAVVLRDPEDDSFGRHRLELLVLSRESFIPVELTPPAAHLDEQGWFWREQDLALDEIVPSRRPLEVRPEPPPEIPTEFLSLWGKSDPAEWAKSFMVKFGKQRQSISEELMAAWFTNAMRSAQVEGGSAAEADLVDDLAKALASAVDGHGDPRVRVRAAEALEKYITAVGDAALDFVVEVANRLRNARAD